MAVEGGGTGLCMTPHHSSPPILLKCSPALWMTWLSHLLECDSVIAVPWPIRVPAGNAFRNPPLGLLGTLLQWVWVSAPNLDGNWRTAIERCDVLPSPAFSPALPRLCERGKLSVFTLGGNLYFLKQQGWRSRATCSKRWTWDWHQSGTKCMGRWMLQNSSLG